MDVSKAPMPSMHDLDVASGLLPSLAHLLDSAREKLESDRPDARALLSRATSLIRVEIDRLRVEPGATDDAGSLAKWQIQRVKIYIDTHLERRISLKNLSTVAKLSPAHFCRAFKKSVLVTPHEFVVRRRIERAEMLMLTTETPLSEIAVSCGLADQAHFCKTFRRLRGKTPAAWRRERTERPLNAPAVMALRTEMKVSCQTVTL